MDKKTLIIILLVVVLCFVVYFSISNGSSSIKCENKNTIGYCYSQVAIEKNDSTICDQLKDIEKDMCYDFIAKSKEDASICREKVISINIKEDCYKALQETMSICDEIKQLGYSSDGCYHSLAVQTNNISICEHVQSSNEKDSCLKVIPLNIAGSA